MNDKPHVHKIEVNKYPYNFPTSRKWRIVYGDTQVFFAWSNPYNWNQKKWDRVVGKATRKAIARHDRGSVEAGVYEQRVRERQNQANELVALSSWHREAIEEGKKKYESLARTGLIVEWYRDVKVDPTDGKKYVLD